MLTCDDDTCSMDLSILFCRGWESETSLFVLGTSYLSPSAMSSAGDNTQAF